jgi:NADH-quinone oxidoreductase subunit B
MKNLLIDTTFKRVLNFLRTRSMWIYNGVFGCGCAEMMNALNNVYALERYGIKTVFDPAKADIMIAGGAISIKALPLLIDAYESMAEPRWVISAGACAINGGIFTANGCIISSIADFIPVDITIDGCPPSFDVIIEALFKLSQLIEKGEAVAYKRYILDNDWYKTNLSRVLEGDYE